MERGGFFAPPGLVAQEAAVLRADHLTTQHSEAVTVRTGAWNWKVEPQGTAVPSHRRPGRPGRRDDGAGVGAVGVALGVHAATPESSSPDCDSSLDSRG